MNHFRKISSIDIGDDSSWLDVFFLTFDIDWANDEVLNETIDLIEDKDVSATWFVTHDTTVLNRLRKNPKFELGIHPNFNWLLEGDDRNGRNAREVIERLLAIVPEATSVRSHAMTQSSVLLDLFNELGLTHDVNHFIPVQTGIELKPWKLWNDLIRTPYNWEDDIQCLFGLEYEMLPYTKFPGLKIFNFHPIHVFLNTENIDRYERTRSFHNDPKTLCRHSYEGYGTRSKLIDLMSCNESWHKYKIK